MSVPAEIAARYHNNRKRFRFVPATVALYWARSNPLDRYPTLEWSEHRDDYTPRATGTVDGFDITVSVRLDEYPDPNGSFDDTWRPGAMQTRDWRPGSWNTLRWYHPMTTVSEHIKALRDLGYSRQVAYELAVSYVRAEMNADITPENYVISADASKEGITLGSAIVHGFDVPEDQTEAYRQLQHASIDLIDEAVSEARANLAKLRSAE